MEVVLFEGGGGRGCEYSRGDIYLMEVVLFGGGGGRGCEYSRGDTYLMEVELIGAVEAGDVNTVDKIFT